MAKRDFKFCSIIVTHYHKDDERSTTMMESIMSLIKNTKYPYELTVIDNGDSEEDTDFLLELVKRGKINTYIRNANNMHFGYARNQGMCISQGDYICIADNDIRYKEGWLSKCIEVIEGFPEEKMYATPIHYPGNIQRYDRGYVDFNGESIHRSMRAGSNCFVIKREDMRKIGLFKPHRVAGSKWTDKAVKLGYLAYVVGENLIEDMGLHKGYNMKKSIPIKLDLHGESVYFNVDAYENNDIYHREFLFKLGGKRGL